MLLTLRKLKKYFPASKNLEGKTSFVKAVDDVNLDIHYGENLGLVGESGSGKTTVARLILKIYRPDAGSIVFQGNDITHFSSKEMGPVRKHMQMVFQDPYSSLDPRYTVRGILKEADEVVNSEKGRQERMERILEAVNMPSDCLERYPYEFSGGERQRIAIARTLMLNPKLLILDEAVSSLDVLIQEQIIGLLKDLQKEFNLTYLFITHNLRVVKKICEKVAVMYKGKIVELASVEELFNNPLHAYTKELLSSAINYEVKNSASDFVLNDNSWLIDRGNGHFVIN